MALLLLLAAPSFGTNGAGNVSTRTGTGNISTRTGTGNISTVFSGGAGNGLIIHYDTFTEASNQALDDHTPNTGTWGLGDDGDTKLIIDASTDELTTLDNTQEYFWSPSSTPSTRSLTIMVRGKTGAASATAQFSVGIRDGDTPNGDWFKAKITGDGAYTLFKTTDGSSVVVASGTIAGFSTSTYYTLGMADSALTNQITMTIDGVVKWSQVDASFIDAKGIFFGERETTVRIDSMTVTRS
jgi:hypothetical protein